MGGIIKMVHRSDDPNGPFKTVSEVAEYLEVHVDTIRRWGKALGIPNHKMMLGEEENSFVWLYTEADIKELDRYSKTLSPGRPKQQIE